MAVTPAHIRATILELLRQRGPDKTACPSEVARLLSASGWRPLMPHVREAAAALAERGQLFVTQRGQPVDARTARGPIRLRLRG